MLRSLSILQRGAAALLTAAVVAACGSGSHQPGAHAPRTTSINGQRMTIAQANHDMLRFAACMKTHGVQGLPDPVAAPGAFKHALTGTAPQFSAAMTACGHLLPGGAGPDQGLRDTARQVDAMLAFARCMRGHGFNRFPDPTSAGITHEMLAQAGIDLHQPAVVRAADSCVHVTHGLLTRAVVARFIAGH